MTLNSVILSGAGNTFHFLYDFEINSFSQDSIINLVKSICNDHPADGVVFLNRISDTKLHYKWNFYNNDGSIAAMCGNATRCVGYYAKNILKEKSEKFLLDTSAGLIQISALENNMYSVLMPTPHIKEHNSLFCCNTGVPHVVIDISPKDEFKKLQIECKKIRNSADFSPGGTNVTLIKIQNDKNNIQGISYERGVEDFTQACGTGAIAAALFMYKNHKIIKTNIEMPGGTISIDLSDIKQPKMTGAAEHLKDCIYEFKI